MDEYITRTAMTDQPTTDMPAPPADSSLAEWEAARTLLRAGKSPPANFSATIRTLITDWLSNRPLQIRKGPGFEVRRFLRSGTVKATYYYASKAYRPDILAAEDLVTLDPFVRSYSHFDHAVLLAYACLFRLFAKRSDPEEWGYVQEPLYDALDTGAYVGRSVQAIGLGFGLLVRGMRVLHLAPFLWSSKKAFQEYRRHLKKRDLSYDEEYERRVWGCTNAQLASITLQTLGFNNGVAEAFYEVVANVQKPVTDTKFYRPMRAADQWLYSLIEYGKPPDAVAHDFKLDGSGLAQLMKDLDSLRESHERVEWLNKGRGNITLESTPELFSTEAAPPDEEKPETI